MANGETPFIDLFTFFYCLPRVNVGCWRGTPPTQHTCYVIIIIWPKHTRHAFCIRNRFRGEEDAPFHSLLAFMGRAKTVPNKIAKDHFARCLSLYFGGVELISYLNEGDCWILKLFEVVALNYYWNSSLTRNNHNNSVFNKRILVRYIQLHWGLYISWSARHYTIFSNIQDWNFIW